MPVGRNCRSCGAALPPDIGWCTTCYTQVSLYSAREPLHERGAYVGVPMPTPRTSRWRAGPTTFGPLGRILITLGLLVFLPWGGLGGLSAASALQLWFLMGWVLTATLVLRHVWKRERVADDAPPSAIERFRERHPVLGRPIRLGTAGRAVMLLVAGGAAVAAWLGLDDFDRYVWAVLALVLGLGIFLATWNDL